MTKFRRRIKLNYIVKVIKKVTEEGDEIVPITKIDLNFFSFIFRIKLSPFNLIKRYFLFL